MALVQSNDLVVYEALKVRNLVKNRQLAKSISDASWYQFTEWLNYFAKIYRIVCVAVPPHFTTQDCSVCGTRVQKTLSTRTHQCPNCQTVFDRDHNAAINILKKGLQYLGNYLNGTVGQTETEPNALGESDLWVFSGDIENLSCLVEQGISNSDVEKRRQELIGDLTHELRTPLTVVRGYLEELADGAIEPNPELYQKLVKETRRLERLTHDLQELSTVSLVAQSQKRHVIKSIIDSLIAQFSPQEAKNPETAEDWFNQGLEQANLGNWSNAIADWEQALTIDPQLASAWHNRGSALAMIGNYEEALNSYDRALEITPNDHQIINARGSALYGLQRWQEALECWQQVLEADDNFYQAWYNRGSTLENLGETQAAIACYQKALGIVPDFELAQTRLEALLGQKPPEDDGNPPA